MQELSGLGPLTQIGELGEMSYHGDKVKREFSVHSWEAGVDVFGVREFNHDIETFLLPGEFCANCEAIGHRGRVAIWRCRGHVKAEARLVRPAAGVAGPAGPASTPGEGPAGP